MRRFILSIVIVFSMIMSGEAQYKQLSPRAKVYFMLTGPYYGDFASVWGHSALWIKDDISDIDITYNYGGAAYGPNFLLKLVSGRLKFYLDVKQSYEEELKTCKRARRDVDIFELNLNRVEKQRLFEYLQNNAKDENKFYLYEFYLKNCTTFTYGAMEKNIDGEIVYPEYKATDTYRDIFDETLGRFPLPMFLIKIVAGVKNDYPLSLKERFFEPRFLTKYLKRAKIKTKSGERPLFKDSKVIYKFDNPELYTPYYKKPEFVVYVLLFLELVLFFFSYFKGRIVLRFYDKLWYLIAFVFSLFIMYTMFFTHYVVTKWNFNIFWANPLFILVFFIKGERKVLLFKLLSVLLAFILVGSFILPQRFYISVLAMAAILLLKTLKYGFLKHKFKN